MRLGPVALLSIFALAGCAGQIRDYVGPRSSIVTPQLIRYGLGLAQVRCVGGRLGDTLRPLQLRRFARAAGAVRQGYYDPSRLTMRDLLWVATSMEDREVRMMLERANGACGVDIAAIAAAPESESESGPGVEGVTILGPGILPPPSGPPAPRVPRGAPAPPVQRAAAWLNLGAAGSGQSIAIDATTVEQDGTRRSAWFRLTDPGAQAPSADRFLLHIDCARRTINAKARERRDATGAVVDSIVYPDNPLPVEGGTVMEIAYLSLCT